MNRYLTPAKVGLLVLISLYCELDLSGEASVRVLSFLVSQLHQSPLLDNQPEQLPATDLEAFQYVLSNPSSPVPGRSLYDLWVKRLWSIENLHLFHTFFTSLERYIAKPRGAQQPEIEDEEVAPRVVLARVSPLGVFVRRAQLEFTRVQFEEVVSMWTLFTHFRAPSEVAFRKKNPSTSFDANSSFGVDFQLSGQDVHWTQSFHHAADVIQSPLGSQYDLERLLEFQLERFQRFGTRLSPTLKQALQESLKRSPKAPASLSYVRFFDAWKSGDYFSSFDELHRYFDSKMQAGDKSSYQYALLNTAILQADFDCFSEALATMNETIAIARENQDMDCLNFCLSWLNHLNKAHPEEMKLAGYSGVAGVGSRGLDFLKAKAKETGNWSLLSSTLLSEIGSILSEGDAWSQGIVRLYQSSALNLNHGIESMYATHILMSSSVFARAGLSSMAKAQLDLVLDCYGRTSSEDEITRACCSKAVLMDRISSRTRASLLEDPRLMSAQRNLKLNQYVTAHSVYLAARIALYKTQITTTSSLVDAMLQLPALDPDLAFAIKLLRVEHQIALTNYGDGVDMLDELTEHLAETKADISHRIMCLVAKAKIWTMIGKPEMGYSILIRASHASLKTNLLPLAWMATGELANVLTEMGECEAAREMLDAIIPQALMTQDATTIARLYMHQASAHAALADRARTNVTPTNPADSTKPPAPQPPSSSSPLQSTPSSKPTQTSHRLLTKAENYLECAGRYAHRVSDVKTELEVFVKRSVIARARGDGEVAEGWADRYLALVEDMKKEDEEAL